METGASNLSDSDSLSDLFRLSVEYKFTPYTIKHPSVSASLLTGYAHDFTPRLAENGSAKLRNTPILVPSFKNCPQQKPARPKCRQRPPLLLSCASRFYSRE